VQRFLRARQQASEDYTAGCERRSRWRRRFALIAGGLVGGVAALVIRGEHWVFPILTAGVGASAAWIAVRRECEALGGCVIYGGATIAFTLCAHFVGLASLYRPQAFDILFLFAWAFLIGTGALVGFLAEQDRSLHAG
jgi:hypothetical protein